MKKLLLISTIFVAIASHAQTTYTINSLGNNLTCRTNSNGMAPDFGKAYTLVTTNAAFTVLAPVNVDTEKILDQTTVFMVTNSTAAAVLITPPANVHVQGTWYVTNLTSITFFCHGGTGFTNAVAFPLW